MKKTVSATEARVHFGELLREVSEDGATYIVERGGKPEAVVISTGEFERLNKTSRPDPDCWVRLEQARATFQKEYKGTEPPDPVELISAGRQERDDAILGDLLRREPENSATQAE